MTMGIRASAGTRFRAMLHPTHPALRAVDERGLRLMMAEGGKWGAHAPSRVVRDASPRTSGGKIFDAGARRIAREARALPFELKPKTAPGDRNNHLPDAPAPARLVTATCRGVTQ